MMADQALLEPELIADDPAVAPAEAAEPPKADEILYEVVDGAWVEIPPMSYYAAEIATNLGAELYAATKGRATGRVIVEGLFRLTLPDGRTRDRRPDVAFFTAERWPLDRPRDPESRATDAIPDLAVEVTSPNDRAEDQRGKILEYFEAGVRLVWVVYPAHRLIDVFEAPDRVRVLSGDAELDGGEVVPGFRVGLATLFGPAPLASPGT